MRLARFTPVLLVLALSACDKASNEGGDFPGGVGTKAVTIFDPVAASPQFPFPIDLLFAGFTDPTLNIPNPTANPAVVAVNEQDGWSTTASLFTDLTGFVDYDSVAAGLLIIDASTGARLTAGTDFTIQQSPAIDTAAPAGPINTKRSRILIEPLKPLKPSTQYIVALTTAIRSTAGEPIVAGDLFRVVRSTTPVSQQTEPALTLLNATQKGTLEAIRQQYLPMFQGLAAAGLPADQIAMAWPFTTQSTTLTLQRMAAAATAAPLTLFPSGQTTAALGLPAPLADIYVGQFTLPYYLTAPSVEAPTAPLTQFWKADVTKPNLAGTFLGQVPCGAFATGATLPAGAAKPSNSTTLCYPLPLKQSNQTVPVILTIPQTTMPDAGWPVAIVQHGITGNRSQALGLATAMTQAGFAVIAIDLPLHGIVATDPSVDPTAALRVPGTTERTFNLDLVNNTTGAAGPDAKTDGSGTHFINLASLTTSRDNLRQAVSDLLVLSKSLVPRDGSGNGAVFVIPPGVPGAGTVLPIKFDTTKVRYVGHSLGGIVMTTFLGVNGDSSAAVLAMPGGGVAKLLDASASFGPRIAAGLAGNGVAEGTDTYETFLRFAQTLVDSGDPLNFAAAAKVAHPLFMIEVVGDAVVPNCALKGDASCPTTDTITISGYLSGTTPLARLMGLSFRPGPGETEAITLPLATPNVLLGPAARSNIVRFAQGDHGSILSPTASPAATVEMQKLTASFLGSNGLCLPIGGACPAPAPAPTAD